jgi:CxC6 like cysteine cluster associated with KDZ transposases
MYSFHGSASAYMEYWNNSFGVLNQDKPLKLSHHHVWQAFVQESIRTIATSAKVNLELNDSLGINEVTKEAFNAPGEHGLIRAADQHSCTECTQKYKATSDIDNGGDPAAVVGVDENQTVPPLANSDSSTPNIVPRENIQIAGVDNEPAFIKLIVMDGIMMGPQHCAFGDCTADLANACGGVFCSVHDLEYGAKCRVHNCLSPKISGTQACHQHKEEWSKYEFHCKPAIYSGMK